MGFGLEPPGSLMNELLASEVTILMEHYEDMFSHTAHVECVVLISKK